MRNKFAELLYKYGSKNKNVYLVAADISPAGSIEKFRKKHSYYSYIPTLHIANFALML